MRLMDDMSRDKSRPNSVLRGRPNSQNRQNASIIEYGDDVETIKNSMINLLNVVIEGEPSNEDPGPQNTIQGRKLVELSQEAISKMQNQSMHQDTDAINQNAAIANYENMYDELNCIAYNNKIQIMFKTQDDGFNVASQNQEGNKKDQPENDGEESYESSEEERKTMSLNQSGHNAKNFGGRTSEIQQRRPSS